jgi:hypothetical protein
MYSPPSLLLSDLTTKELEEEYFVSKYRKIDYALRSGTSCFADLVERTVDDIDAMTIGGFRAYYRVAPAVRSASASALPSAEQVAAQRLAKRFTKQATKQARWRSQAFADICEILEKEKDQEPCTAERVADLLNDRKGCDEELIGLVVQFVEEKGWVSVSQETPAEPTPAEPTPAVELSAVELSTTPLSVSESSVSVPVFTPVSVSAEESSADLQIVLQELPLQIGLSLEEWPHLPEPATPIRLTLHLQMQMQKVPLQKVSQKIQKSQKRQRRIPKCLPALSLPLSLQELLLQKTLQIRTRPLF